MLLAMLFREHAFTPVDVRYGVLSNLPAFLDGVMYLVALLGLHWAEVRYHSLYVFLSISESDVCVALFKWMENGTTVCSYTVDVCHLYGGPHACKRMSIAGRSGWPSMRS